MKYEDLQEGQDVVALCTRCGAVHDWAIGRKVPLGGRVILSCKTGKQSCGLNAQFVTMTGAYAPKPKEGEA